MLLAIDIGNTNVVIGVFDGRSSSANWRVGTNAQITPDEYAMIFKDLFGFAGLEFRQITGVIISTVVPPILRTMVEMSRKYFRKEPHGRHARDQDRHHASGTTIPRSWERTGS